MGTEQVRMWRPDDHDHLLLMAGQTTHYAVEPRGEYVFGVIARAPMRSRRGPERRLVQPGQILAWDPSTAHAGTAVDDAPWSSRLMVVEIDHLAAIAGDQDNPLRADVAFPEPVLSDPELTRDFLRLHTALETPTTRLERDERLAGWMRGLLGRSSAAPAQRSRRSVHDDHALRVAGDYLGDRPERNVGLDELAAAGIGKFRLIRLFRDRTGLAPHALQIAHRIRHARRLLEGGMTVTQAAASTGFADQSHLHRHFQRGLGVTPGEYQRRFNG